MAVVADASALALDALVDAAFAGKTAELEVQFAKTKVADTAPGAIISAALRHVAMLHKARLAVEDGQSAEQATEGIYVHFSRKRQVETALKPGRPPGSPARWRSSPKPRSIRAASRTSRTRLRSARCCRSPSTPAAAVDINASARGTGAGRRRARW